jgi:hypothetical protein
VLEFGIVGHIRSKFADVYFCLKYR